MQERILNRQCDAKMQFITRHTSIDRAWSGFKTSVYDTSEGIGENPMFTTHMCAIHLTAPVYTATRCDGSVLRRIRVPGDMHLIPAGYGSTWQNDGPAAELVMNLTPALVNSAADAMGLDADRLSFAPILHLRDEKLQHIAAALKAELESEGPLGRLYADSLGLAFAAHLVRRYSTRTPRAISGVLPRRRLQSVIDHVHDNLAQDLSLTELAAVAHMSPSHFKQLFKQSMGVPVHQYVIRCRVEYAMDLLASGKHSATEAALQCGFASQSHLARCMRRLTGMTPGDIRRGVL
jgi:AraC family transcriptional regulator